MNTEGIKGHAAPLKILSRMLSTGHLPHALLFTGISGIGKKLTARRALNTLFCKSDSSPLPCLKCESCRKFTADAVPDYIEIKPDDKGRIIIGSPDNPEENSVRYLINRLSRRSITGRFAVIIDGIDKIAVEGQNALLKTIEEPQEGTGIILISSNRSNILPTIISRSMEIHFTPLSPGDIQDILKNHASLTPFEAALSGGSVETALLLTKNENMRLITDLAQQISDAASGDTAFTPDIKGITEKIGIDSLFTIMLNFFRAALLESLDAASFHIPGSITDDPEKLKSIIKILLASEKGLSNNMNQSLLLKGLIYNQNMITSDRFITLPGIFKNGSRR